MKTLVYSGRVRAEDQLEAEEMVAAQLFDNFDEHGQHTHAVVIVTTVCETFSTEAYIVSPAQIRELYFEVVAYLDQWFAQLEEKRYPSEEECNKAGKELALLIVSSIRPDLILAVENK